MPVVNVKKLSFGPGEDRDHPIIVNSSDWKNTNSTYGAL